MKKQLTTIAASIALLGTVMVSQTATAEERLISAGSAVTELVFALHAEKSLVGVDVTSHLPDSVSLPKIGYHRSLSAEGLLALNPTTLVGSGEMGPAPVLAQLKSTGVDVKVVNTDADVDGLMQRIDDIAQLVDRTAEASQLKQIVTQQVAKLSSNQPAESSKKKVLFLLIHDGRAPSVAGNDTTPDAIIKLAGAINPAATQLNSYKPLSTEAMVEMQPDVILVSGRSYEKLGGPDAIIKMLPLLAATPAGINKQIVTIDGSALVGGLGLKSLAEAERLNQLLYTN
ncbi:heme/hemin ABC transporter substrate-binding protein [Vibrio navarrensis]|uniref:heme/hemin ABC transporter substrate-binding protein n=1 Tax=Vibrio navarrensis TaxID=29495 RepID=UPI00186A2281|nr:ABC transporter substrate-binding protein [Vibrio navarrensis]MBE4599100.1 hemin ABC transporter substrate-binding protein [Vibrio navarrensis]